MVLRHSRYKRGRERVVSGGGGENQAHQENHSSDNPPPKSTTPVKILPIPKSQKSCSRQKTPDSHKTMLQTWFSDILVTNEGERGGGGAKIKPIKPIKKIMVQTNTNHPKILPIPKSQKSCSRQKTPDSHKTMLQTWFSDILVTNEDERGW